LKHDHQPLLFTIHTRYDIYGHYLRRMMPFVPEEPLSATVTRHVARFANRCDAVVAPSQSLEEVLTTWGVRAPIEVIPNGIELERFHCTPRTVVASIEAAPRAAVASNGAIAKGDESAPSREALRARWNVPLHAPLAVYLGRLAPEKNVEVLLESFALARQTVPDARLMLIGDGPSEDELHFQARRLGLTNTAIFTGALPYEDVPDALRMADVFASSSVSEVHPLTFIEAMAAGLPCIGTPSPGVAETIVANRNGWIAAPEPESFSSVLIEALGNRDECARRGVLALEDSRDYAIETTAARLLALYQSTRAAK